MKIAPTGSKEVKVKLRRSNDIEWGNMWIIVHGPPGSGKTTLFATLSDDWPGDLKDCLLCTLDHSGHIALADTGCEANILVLDDYLVETDDDGNFVRDVPPWEASQNYLSAIEQFVRENKPKFISLDPISEWSRIMVGEAKLKYGDHQNKYKVWDIMGLQWNQIITRLKRLPCIICMGFHSASKLPEDTKARSAKHADLVDAACNIEIDIAGQSAKNQLRGLARFVGSIHKLKDGRREVFFSQHDGFEAKCSFENKLKDWTKPNLKEMFDYLKGEKK